MSFCEASEFEQTEKDEMPPPSFFHTTFFTILTTSFATRDADQWHSGVQGHPGRAAGAPVRLCSRNFFLLSPNNRNQDEKSKLSEHGPFDIKGPERASEPEVD
jgi:hypothetical protein